jgi:hypothetical protein
MLCCKFHEPGNIIKTECLADAVVKKGIEKISGQQIVKEEQKGSCLYKESIRS